MMIRDAKLGALALKVLSPFVQAQNLDFLAETFTDFHLGLVRGSNLAWGGIASMDDGFCRHPEEFIGRLAFRDVGKELAQKERVLDRIDALRPQISCKETSNNQDVRTRR